MATLCAPLTSLTLFHVIPENSQVASYNSKELVLLLLDVPHQAGHGYKGCTVVMMICLTVHHN